MKNSSISRYYYLTEGKKFFLDILNKRYSTSKINSTEDVNKAIENIFERFQK